MLKSSGNAFSASASQTRPNDTNAYSALDVVGDSTSAPTVMVFDNIGSAGGRIVINYMSLEVDVAAVPSGMGGFRLHLFDTRPTAIADNAAFNLIAGDRAKHIGMIDVGTPEDMGDTLFVQNDAVRLPAKLADGSRKLYGIMKTLNGYTPTASIVKTVVLHSMRTD